LSALTEIPQRLDGVRKRIADAASRAGRDPSSVRLVAVSKTFPLDAIRTAAQCGQTDFGENKVQEGQDKILAAGSLPLRWHLIGHLQSNKAKKAAALFDVIHSIDSVDLLKKVDDAAREKHRQPDVLVQVDLAREATKYGATESELPEILEAAMACKAVRLTGLMLLPPLAENPDEARPFFRALRALRDGHVARGIPANKLKELSMGMSHDFEVAIEEGATMVRVGSAIFGERTYGR
jgi:pyridoxal phosphate enzyme (YggS family)